MAFDTKEYALAMEQFILKMEKISDFIHPGTQEAMDPLCKALRIAQVEAVFYEVLEYDELKWGGRAVFYREGAFDEGRCIKYREQTEEGNLIEYFIYQVKGEADWEPQELEKIQIFIKLLFTFQGRILIMQVVDNLTFRDQEFGVYNLNWFMKNANLKISEGEIGKYAACYFNLKHFSVINQQIGRGRGTMVMGKFIRKLKDRLGSKEMVCRVGGDNFVALFFKSNLKLVMDYLKGVGIVYDEKEQKRVWITTYAGYYMIPGNCKSAANIMDCLGTAINMAKNVRKTEYVFFDEELMQGIRVGKMIEASLPEAIQREEFQVYYQPKILLKDYRLIGAEALCRWFQNGKVVAPGEFVPILEQSKLICMLDFYMLEHVCRDIRR